jgi:L-alanine-DL-glutamate epimerase-like enolase superfamily enzyme
MQQLKIDRIDIYRMNIPLISPFVISLETVTQAQNIVVRITANNGLSGFGECSPYRTIAGETQDSGYAVAPLLAKSLIGNNPLNLGGCIRSMNQAIAGNRCIKSAFDLALYDLAAQIAGLPLYAFLGGDPNKSLKTDMTVGIGTPEKMAQSAKVYQDAGFYAIKLKLGTTVTADTARVKAVREAIGDELPVRVDANQGWNLVTAAQALKELAPYHIEYCEEPISASQFLQLAQLRQESPIPIMADESCFDHHDAIRLIQLQACDYFNIKLSKAGGIHNALKIAHIAEAAGMNCQVGCFSESRLGISALAHFAMAATSVTQFDMDAPLMLAQDPVQGGVTYGAAGSVIVPDTPGIGAHLSDSYLKTLEGIVFG